MWVVRAENLRNVSSEMFCVKEFWGKNDKKCQYWAMTFFAYMEEMRVSRDKQKIHAHLTHYMFCFELWVITVVTKFKATQEV